MNKKESNNSESKEFNIELGAWSLPSKPESDLQLNLSINELVITVQENSNLISKSISEIKIGPKLSRQTVFHPIKNIAQS
jgi:hypothetical protein